MLDAGTAPVRLRKMSILVSKGPDAGRRVSVENERFLVGKDDACDLAIADPTVSRKHFEILKKGDSFLIRDLDSTNGTVLNGTRIREAFLSPSSRISMGNVEMIFQAVYETPDSETDSSEKFGSLKAASSSMKSIFGMLRKAAGKGTTVLLRGETGTGKSVIAKAIHEEGNRKGGPFVVFDCASVAPTLIESELFGARKGAFTGAFKSRPGACEQANGGTLFLDEIGDLPLELQSRLLRVIEEREVRRLGAIKAVELDMNVIAASRFDLQKAADDGLFRRDLYYRIAVMDMEIPPLRERKEDIPLLCNHFLMDSHGPAAWDRLAPALREELQQYGWPGNIRELRNVLERIQCTGQEAFQGEKASNEAGENEDILSFNPHQPFKEAKEELISAFEKEYLNRLLEKSGGKIAPAAREAGLNRKYFYDLLKKHGLHGGTDE